jgi:MFS family permease
MAGLAALLGSTFMLCFGRTEAVLIIARVLQGISAAVVWTVGMEPYD